MKYREALAKEGLLEKAANWLKSNPPPPEWKESEWAWAFTEMPVWPWEFKR